MKKITSGYINFFDEDGTELGIKLKTFKGINVSNSYQLDYVRHIPAAVNYIVASLIYWSKRKGSPQKEIIVTDSSVSKAIGCSRSTSWYIFKQLSDLFNFQYDRAKWRGGSRIIKLNKQFIDFLSIYSEQEFSSYLDDHNINDSDMIYALRQIYQYRLWEVPDSKLSKEQRDSKTEFMNDMRNHYHYVATNNKSASKRIELIKKDYDKLTKLQQNQLDKIINALKEGKLVYYLHRVLINLEQKITALKLIKKETINTTETQTSLSERNIVPGEAERVSAIAAVSQKIPEDVEPRFFIEVVASWNNMIKDQSIPRIKDLNQKRIKSIRQIVKLYGKDQLLETINKVPGLYHNSKKYQYKIKFDSFMQPERFLVIMETEIKEDVVVPWLDDYIRELTGAEPTPTMEVLDIPNFNSIEEAIEWWNNNK